MWGVTRFIYLVEVLGIEPGTLCLRSRHPTAELEPPRGVFLVCGIF